MLECCCCGRPSALALRRASPLSGASAHDIYTGVKGKDGLLCCGGSRLRRDHPIARRGGRFEFLDARAAVGVDPRGAHHLPAHPRRPADDSDTHHAHLCYRPATEGDRFGPLRVERVR